jgi:hypothetical protein
VVGGGFCPFGSDETTTVFVAWPLFALPLFAVWLLPVPVTAVGTCVGGREELVAPVPVVAVWDVVVAVTGGAQAPNVAPL